MYRRLIWPVLVCASVAAAFALQQTFPHRIGPPGVRTEYLGRTRLPKSEKDAIIALVFKNSDPSGCVAPERSPQQELDDIRIAQAPLGSPLDKNLLVQASDMCNCGGTGNCAFWVLRKGSKGFDVLLATDMVQQFSVEKNRSHGYKDLMTASHDSATMQGLTLYQFDGKQYRATRCATSDYERREDGSVADKPTITPVDCIQE